MVQDVAQWIGAPGPYLSKVFHALGKARLVDTKRGRRGGVILVLPAKEITLEQIADAMDGDEWRTSCLLGLTVCSDERACPVHAFWTIERTRIYNELQNTTLADVARFERSHRLAHPPAETSAVEDAEVK